MHVCAKSLQSYWTLRPYGLKLPKLLCPQDFPGKNTGVGCYALLQGIFLTQGSNPYLLSLLHWQMGSLPLAPHGKQAPEFFGWIKPKQPKGSLKGKTQ